MAKFFSSLHSRPWFGPGLQPRLALPLHWDSDLGQVNEVSRPMVSRHSSLHTEKALLLSNIFLLSLLTLVIFLVHLLLPTFVYLKKKKKNALPWYTLYVIKSPFPKNEIMDYLY